MRSTRWMILGLISTIALLSGGCPGGLGGNTVRVVVINNTSYSVQPNIKFDSDNGFFGGLFPSSTLDTGLLAPGQRVTTDFNCDELGTIFSDGATQVFVIGNDATADSTKTLQLDEEYSCGDTIRFTFVGSGSDFGVNVEVNGRTID